VLIQVPNGCLTRLTELDSLDRLAEAILLDGLCRPRKTVNAGLWSRLLQVRALPPSDRRRGGSARRRNPAVDRCDAPADCVWWRGIR
jgi:hypothetical protein